MIADHDDGLQKHSSTFPSKILGSACQNNDNPRGSVHTNTKRYNNHREATIFVNILGWYKKEETAVDIVGWNEETVFHPTTLDISFSFYPRTMLTTSGRATATIVVMTAAAEDDNMEK